ncbi:MAG: carbohydrate ABC transporter permease [Bacillota bacterium]|nr:carbohydrate ABC transporter permease [Bacillota bacterium]
MTINKIKSNKSDDILVSIITYTLCAVVLLLTLYPLVFVMSASISEPVRVSSGDVVLWPIQFTIEGYQTILDYNPIWIGYRNTIFYTVVGVLINLLVTVPCAYAMSRKELIGRNQLMLLFTFTMFFSGGLIPTYLMMKSLQMTNTVFAMLFPGAMSVFNMIITRTYFQNTIPRELQDAALIDGCSNTKLFFRIVLPLSKPIIAVITLYYAVGHWNAFFNALIYLTKSYLYPLQLYLRNILIENQMIDLIANEDSDALEAILRNVQLRESMKYGIVVVSTLPMLVLYPFVQKYFVKGVMIGSLKG